MKIKNYLFTFILVLAFAIFNSFNVLGANNGKKLLKINISTVKQWNDFAYDTLENEDYYSTFKYVYISINKDLNFNNDVAGSAKLTSNMILDGNNKRISNLDGSLIFINKYGIIKNLTFNNINIQGNNMVGVIKKNLGNINNIIFEDIRISGTTTCGPIASSTGVVTNITAKNINIVCDSIAGGVVGSISSHNYHSTTPLLTNVSVDNVNIDRKFNYILAKNNEYDSRKVNANSNFGGLIGKISGGMVNNIVVNNAYITGNNNIGGAFGSIFSTSGALSTVNNITISNLFVDGYSKVGGLGGSVETSMFNGSLISKQDNYSKDIYTKLHNIHINKNLGVKGHNNVSSLLGVAYNTNIKNLKLNVRPIDNAFVVYSYFCPLNNYFGNFYQSKSSNLKGDVVVNYVKDYKQFNTTNDYSKDIIKYFSTSKLKPEVSSDSNNFKDSPASKCFSCDVSLNKGIKYKVGFKKAE